MKQKLKQYLKTTMLLFGMSFFIVSCQKDDDLKIIQQEPLKTQDAFKVSKVGKSKIDENKDLLGRLSNLSEKVEQSRLANANKNIYVAEDDFYINTDYATYMENNVTGYHSYTFPVYRTEEADGIENVLLSLQADGSYKAFLIVYDLNDQERLDLQNELNVDLTGKTTIYSLEDDSFVDDIFSKVLASGDCVGILMCPYGGDDHIAGQACIDAERGNLYLDTSMCDSGGGADTTDTTNNTSGSDTSGGHVEGGSNGSVGATAITCTRNCIDEACNFTLTGILANLSLSDAEICWLNKSEQSGIKQQITDYLNDNGSSDFAEWVIEFENLPTDPCGLTHDCLQSIQTMADGLRFCGEEGNQMADYFESVINDSNSFDTMGELQDFYDQAVVVTKNFVNSRFNTILLGFAEGVKPIVELALFEIGGTYALKLLQKLPTSYITTPIANVINRLLTTTSEAFSSFKHAKKFGIKSYAQLEADFALGTTRTAEGVQFHHLIEQRFKNNPAVTEWLGSTNTANWNSIVLTPAEHQVFTNAWRQRIGYGNINGSTGFNTSTATIDVIKNAADEIYANYPEILQILGL